MATTRTFLAVCLACVGMAVAAQADDRTVNGTSKSADAAIEEMGKLAVKAAHPTAQYPRMLSWESRRLGDKQIKLRIKMEYFGEFTGNRYLADVEFETIGPRPVSLRSINYFDDNPIPETPGWKARFRRAVND